MKFTRRFFIPFVILLFCAIFVLITHNYFMQNIGSKLNSCIKDQSEFAMDNNTRIKKNLNWRKIQIGKSNNKDVIELIGNPVKVSDFRQGKTTYCIYQYMEKSDDILDPKSQSVWLSDGIVLALQFRATDYLLYEDETEPNLNKLIDNYGIPEIISFSVDGPYSRALVWLSRGIQVDVTFHQDSTDNNQMISMDKISVSSIVYFLPNDLKNYNQTPFSSYRENRIVSDVFESYPKNPFIWP